MKCEVCVVEVPKYKCPTCRCRYCSVKCYKTHKATGCSPIDRKDEPGGTPADMETAGISAEANSTALTEDQVPIDKLKLLGESEELLSMLENPHLREIMTDLAKSDPSSVSEKLEKAMHEPIFTEFADQCLSVVESDKGKEYGSLTEEK